MVLKASVKFFGDRENPAVQGCFSASAGPPPSLRPFIFVPLSLCNSVVGFFKPLLIALFIISATKTRLQHREGAVRGLTGTGLVFSWHQPRSETCCRGPRCERMMRYFTGFQTDLDRSRGPRVRSKKGNACQDAKLPQWLAAVRHLQPPASPHPAHTFTASQRTDPSCPCPREECCSHQSPKPALPRPDPIRGMRHTCGSFGHTQLTSTLQRGECRAGNPWCARPRLPWPFVLSPLVFKQHTY